MMRRLAVLGSLIVTMVLQGCGADHSGDQIIDLQKQLSLLSRQIEQDHKELNDLRTVDTGLRQSLDAAEAEINRLKALETPPPATTKGSLGEEDLTVMPVPMPTRRQFIAPTSRKSFSIAAVQQSNATVSCPQVWALLGQGRSAAEAAKGLHSTVERVRSCERQIGRSRTR